jgi:hypothetical protein
MPSNPALAVRLYTWFAIAAGIFAATETFGRIETAHSGGGFFSLRLVLATPLFWP